MRIQVDERFGRDVERFRLRFTCADCLHFLPREGNCAHEWPNEEHRDAPGLDGERVVVFCKEFELR